MSNSQYPTKAEMAQRSSDRERLLESGSVPLPVRVEMSAFVLRLARRLDKDPDELARSYSADTLRRTKYPVIEILNEDGTRTYKHDPGIEEAPKSLYA